MAFTAAPGWGNLPNGNFSPIIFSKKVQMAFRQKTVVGDITNSDYFGEIKNYGDTVRILKEPEISVTAYTRGQQVVPQDIDDEEFQLTINKANKFAFQMEDIEKSQSHVDFMALAKDRAAYNLMIQYDKEVLGYMAGYAQTDILDNADTVNTTVNGVRAVSTAGTDELLSSMKLKKGDFDNITTSSAGDHSIPVGVRMPGATALPTTYVSPHMIIARMSRLMDQQYVPREGRWVVIDPVMLEVLSDEDSRFLHADYGPSGGLRNGLIMKNWNGFRVYVSNSLPIVGGGPQTTGTANQNTDYGVIVAGHDSAVATAEQINKVETFRSQNSFVDVCRGLHLYGRKILRPEAITTAKYNLAG